MLIPGEHHQDHNDDHHHDGHNYREIHKREREKFVKPAIQVVDKQCEKPTIQLVDKSCEYKCLIIKEGNRPYKSVPVDEKDCGRCCKGAKVLGGQVVGYLVMVIMIKMFSR